MKRFLMVFCSILLVSSCTKSEDKMTLTGTVKGLKKGTLLLQKANDTTIVTIDSVTVKDENFSFITPVPQPELYYLGLKLNGKPATDFIAFFAEPKEISITTTLNNFEVDAVIKGSKNQEKLQEYSKIIQRYTDANLDLTEKSLLARKNGNDSLLNVIEKQQQRNRLGRYLATVNFALQNNDIELAPFLMLNQANKTNIKYLDTVYKSLTPEIKNSKYGKALKSLLNDKK